MPETKIVRLIIYVTKRFGQLSRIPYADHWWFGPFWYAEGSYPDGTARVLWVFGRSVFFDVQKRSGC